MEHYAAIDVSLEWSSVCVVDATGEIVREAKVPSEPEALVAFFAATGFRITRIGLEAGPLSQWLHAGLIAAGLPAILIETRHVKAALNAMTVKTDRNDARGIAQLMRMGWFRPVHVKTLPAHAGGATSHGCSRCCGAGQAPRRIGKPVRSRCCPRNGVGASSAVQVPLRALDIPGR